MQGPRNDKKFEELCLAKDACGGNIYDLLDRYDQQTTARYVVNIVTAYMDGYWNVAVHGEFPTNKSVARLVRDADVRGYSITFIRLPDAVGEELSWQECFAC